MKTYRIWDPFVRVFHWTLAAGFAANAIFTDPESALHENLGFAIAGLLAARLLWGLIGTRHARFGDFWPSRAGIAAQLREIATGRRTVHLGHTPLGAVMILNLFASIAAISLTGWMMTTNAFWGVDWVEELHEVLVVWAGASIALHVAAVIWESRRTGVNLPRAMVTGVKSVPEDAKLAP